MKFWMVSLEDCLINIRIAKGTGEILRPSRLGRHHAERNIRGSTKNEITNEIRKSKISYQEHDPLVQIRIAQSVSFYYNKEA